MPKSQKVKASSSDGSGIVTSIEEKEAGQAADAVKNMRKKEKLSRPIQRRGGQTMTPVMSVTSGMSTLRRTR